VIIKIILTVSVLSPVGFVVGTLPRLIDGRKNLNYQKCCSDESQQGDEDVMDES